MLSIRRRCPDNTHHKISLTPLVVTKRWFAGHISIIRCHFSKHKTGPRQYNLSIIGFNGNGINTNWCWIQTKTSEKYEIDMFSLDGLKTTAVCCSEILKVCMSIVREIVMKGKGMEEGWQLFSSLSRSGKIFALLTDIKFWLNYLAQFTLKLWWKRTRKKIGAAEGWVTQLHNLLSNPSRGNQL